MDELKKVISMLIELASKGRYDVDVQGAQQVTAIITTARRALEKNYDDEVVGNTDEG